MPSRAAVLVVLASSLLAGCGARLLPHLASRQGVLTFSAGSRYLLRYSSPPDAAPVGTHWRGDALAGSPLAFASRPALVLKADDFGAGFDTPALRFLEAVDAAGGVASLGIITHALPGNDGPTLEAYRELDAAGFELWFHGHLHRYRQPNAEFAGPTVAEQRATLELGLAMASEYLGLELHSFGAPGNAIDDNTAEALREVPEYAVWLMGRRDQGVFVVPGWVRVEAKPGTLRPAADVLQDLVAQLDQPDAVDAYILQVHPLDFSEESSARFEELLAGLATLGRTRFSAPYDYYRWQHDRAAVTLTKASDTDYELDLRRAEYDQRLELDPAAAPLPAEVVLLD